MRSALISVIGCLIVAVVFLSWHRSVLLKDRANLVNENDQLFNQISETQVQLNQIQAERIRTERLLVDSRLQQAELYNRFGQLKTEMERTLNDTPQIKAWSDVVIPGVIVEQLRAATQDSIQDDNQSKATPKTTFD